MRIRNKALIFPAIGILGILIAFIFANMSMGLNVHSGEIFLAVFVLLALGGIIPAVMFVKSLKIIQFKLAQEGSDIRKYAIILTSVLGVMLVSLLLAFLWVTF